MNEEFTELVEQVGANVRKFDRQLPSVEAMKNPAFKKTFGDLSAEERMSRVPKGYDKNPRCLLVSSDLALNGSG